MPDKPIPDYMRTLAERVHLLRRRQRYSQAEIAKRADMSPTTLSNIEQAKAPTITVEHLVALARVLGTSPDALLGMKPPARRQRRKEDETGELFPTTRVHAGREASEHYLLCPQQRQTPRQAEAGGEPPAPQKPPRQRKRQGAAD